VAKKQHIYQILIVKRDYHYMYVKADSMDEAEDYVIENKLDDEVLEEYWNDSECEVIGLERLKTHLEGVKTVN
jgi:hypothetical protein